MYILFLRRSFILHRSKDRLERTITRNGQVAYATHPVSVLKCFRRGKRALKGSDLITQVFRDASLWRGKKSNNNANWITSVNILAFILVLTINKNYFLNCIAS